MLAVTMTTLARCAEHRAQTPPEPPTTGARMSVMDTVSEPAKTHTEKEREINQECGRKRGRARNAGKRERVCVCVCFVRKRERERAKDSVLEQRGKNKGRVGLLITQQCESPSSELFSNISFRINSPSVHRHCATSSDLHMPFYCTLRHTHTQTHTWSVYYVGFCCL